MRSDLHGHLRGILRPLARSLTVAALLAPAATRAGAQSSFVGYRTFTFQGCGGGIVVGFPNTEYNPHAACYFGFATVGALNGLQGVQFTYTSLFDSRVRDVGVQYAEVTFRSADVACARLCMEDQPYFPISNSVGAAAFFGFSGLFTYDLASVELSTGALEPRFVVRDAPYADSQPVITFAFVAVPEPSSLALAVGGLVMVCAWMWQCRGTA